MRIVALIINFIPIVMMLMMFNKKELLAPTNIFSLIYFIRIVLPIILLSNIENVELIRNNLCRSSLLDNTNFLNYVFLQTLSYMFVIFGMRVKHVGRHKIAYINPKSYEPVNVQNEMYSPVTSSSYFAWGIVFTLIGFAAFLIMIFRSGGLLYFFSHLYMRGSMLGNMDLLTWLLPLLQYGPLLIVYSFKGTNRSMSVLLILFIMTCGFLCGMGGRKTMIMMLIESFAIFHFTVKKLKIREFLRLKYLLMIIGVFLFFVVVVRFRSEGAFLDFLSNPSEFFNSRYEGLSKLIIDESYVPFFAADVKYFSEHSLWFGSSFLGLLTAIIPSSVYALKPPVDDGMYLYSICQGRTDIIPVMPASSLNVSSYPLETFGSMYSNFGVIGLLIGMFLLGKIISKAYDGMNNNGHSFKSVLIYIQVIMAFELSTLRIFQFFQIVCILLFITFIADKIPVSRSTIIGKEK